MAGQPTANHTQRIDGHGYGGGESGPGVGGEARHRRGLGQHRGLHLLGGGTHGWAGAHRLCHQHILGLDTQRAGREGAEPHAAVHARPYTPLRMERARTATLWRCHQPPRERRQQCRHLHYRNFAQYAQCGASLLRCFCLSLYSRPAVGGHHRRFVAPLCGAQQGLCAPYASPHPSGAQLRLPGAKRAAGNHPTSGAHQDSGERRRHGGQAREYPEPAASQRHPAHTLQPALQLHPQLRVLPHLSHSLPLGGSAHVHAHAVVWRHDSLPATRQPHTESGAQPEPHRARLCQCLHRCRATHGTRRASPRRAGRPHRGRSTLRCEARRCGLWL